MHVSWNGRKYNRAGVQSGGKFNPPAGQTGPERAEVDGSDQGCRKETRRLNYHVANHFPCRPTRVVSFSTLLTLCRWSRGDIIRQEQGRLAGTSRHTLARVSLPFFRIPLAISGVTEQHRTAAVRRTTWSHLDVLETLTAALAPLGGGGRSARVRVGVRYWSVDLPAKRVPHIYAARDDDFRWHGFRSSSRSFFSSFFYEDPVCILLRILGKNRIKLIK